MLTSAPFIDTPLELVTTKQVFSVFRFIESRMLSYTTCVFSFEGAELASKRSATYYPRTRPSPSTGGWSLLRSNEKYCLVINRSFS